MLGTGGTTGAGAAAIRSAANGSREQKLGEHDPPRVGAISCVAAADFSVNRR